MVNEARLARASRGHAGRVQLVSMVAAYGAGIKNGHADEILEVSWRLI